MTWILKQIKCNNSFKSYFLAIKKPQISLQYTCRISFQILYFFVGGCKDSIMTSSIRKLWWFLDAKIQLKKFSCFSNEIDKNKFIG